MGAVHNYNKWENKKEEIILKYATRWDIESFLGKLKLLWDKHGHKGNYNSPKAYNMIRKIVAKSVGQTRFLSKKPFHSRMLWG